MSEIMRAGAIIVNEHFNLSPAQGKKTEHGDNPRLPKGRKFAHSPDLVGLAFWVSLVFWAFSASSPAANVCLACQACPV